ncbi:hypothetical protein PMAYCL1PPCAC_08758, partial [Pristionchus mayeri]
RPRSTDSSDLPIDCRDSEGDDEEKGGKRRSIEVLRDQVKQYKAQVEEAQKIAREQTEQTMEWMEHVNKREMEMEELAEELHRQREEVSSLVKKQQEVYEKYQKAIEASMGNGQRASESLDEANKLRKELEQATKDLNVEKLCLAREKEALVEATNIIAGLLGKSDFNEKVEYKKPLTPQEHMAMRWRYPALEKEKERLAKEIEEKKIAMGRLEFERDELRLELDRVRLVPGGEMYGEISQKLAEVEKANAQLREELAQTTLKAEKESTESQLLANKLKMDNEDLTERVRTLQERLRQNSHGEKDTRTHSTGNTGRRSMNSEEMKNMVSKLEANNGELRREMERLKQRQKEQLDESVRQIEKKDAENDDLLDRNKKLAERLARQRRDTPPAKDAPREDSRRDHHSRLSKGEERGDRGRREEGRREEGSSELRDTVRRLEEEIREEKRKAGLLEADRNDLRVTLKQVRNEKKTEHEERERELQTDVDLKGTRIFQLEYALKEVQDRLEKEEFKTKGISGLTNKIEELTLEVEELKKSLKENEKERKRLDAEVEEQKTINVVLVKTKSGELMEDLTAARKRITELESELQQGCSSAKRARVEEEVEKPREPTPPPPPFVLQAAARAPPKAAPNAPKAAPKGNQWKPAFIPTQINAKALNKQNFRHF